jgi:hypothetical protein
MTSNDYSLYLRNRKVQVSQAGFSSLSSTKTRAPVSVFNYFPLYKGIGLPVNHIQSNKFLQSSSSLTAPDPFSPIQLTGMNLWLDVSDAASITSSGGFVSQWNDKSGKGYNLTQTDNTYKPTYANNLISFSSNRNFDIPNAALNNTTNYDIFVVFNPKVSSNWIFAKQYDGNYSAPALSTNIFVGYTSGTTNYAYFRAGPIPSTVENVNSNSALTISSLQILGIHNTGSVLLFNSNGTTLNTVTGTSSNLPIGNSTTITSFKLGAWYGNSAFQNSGVTNFDICEMLIFNSKLAVSDRQKMEGYLAWKWNLQSNLPSNHPYKNAKPVA